MRPYTATLGLAALLFSLITLLPTALAGTLVEQYWNIEWIDNVNPDGLQPRSVIGVNGTWPPPIFNVNQSDTLRIHATNALHTGVGTALHSHGMFFPHVPHQDGAVGITQCPIPEGQSYTYEPLNSPSSPADREKQWGTFWIHGHYQGQYVDGLRTPLIIHPEGSDRRYTYDEDYTVILGDWYHDLHHDLLNNEFLNPKNPTGAEPVPKSGLMYIAKTSASLPTASYLPGFNENVTLPFMQGKTYRLRVINMSALSAFRFWIDGHDMRIIEVDGVDTQPLPVDYFPLSAAQRYSVLVSARNDTTNDWMIHADMDPDMFDAVPDDLQLNITSRISYAGSSGEQVFGPVNAVGSAPDGFPYFDDTQLVPFDVEPMPEADVTYNMTVVFDTYENNINYASFNGISFISPKTPSLLTQTSMGIDSLSAAVYGPSSNAMLVPLNTSVELRILNTDAGHHPFHLHGYHFAVVHKSQDDTSNDPSINPPFDASQANPMRRDTVMVPGGGSATLRFRASNPGAWIFHCHIEWHLQSGLAAVLLAGTAEVQAQLAPTIAGASTAAQCAAQGIAAAGNAAGLRSTTDFAGLPLQPKMFTVGWTPKAVGTFFACALSALVGLASILVYGSSSPEEEEEGEKESVDGSH